MLRIGPSVGAFGCRLALPVGGSPGGAVEDEQVGSAGLGIAVMVWNTASMAVAQGQVSGTMN